MLNGDIHVQKKAELKFSTSFAIVIINGMREGERGERVIRRRRGRTPKARMKQEKRT